MHGMEDSRQARGYGFERFLKRWFDAWGLQARGSFKLVGEQIDGSFEHRGSVYLIEAKWTNARTDAAALRSFQEKAGDGFEGTHGLFVSYAGFTDEGLKAFHPRRVWTEWTFMRPCGDASRSMRSSAPSSGAAPRNDDRGFRYASCSLS